MEKQSISCAESRMTATEFAESHYKTPALVEHGIRCGKSNCRCATSDYRHGPYVYLYWRDALGHPRRRYVRKAEVGAVRDVIHLRQAIDRERRAALAQSRGYLRELRELRLLGERYGLW